MIRTVSIVAGAFLLLSLALQGCAQRGDEPAAGAALPTAHVRFEQNATDGDVEVVFEIGGPSDGLVMLKVVAPDGRTVVDCSVPNRSTLGLRQFAFESPEPRDVAALKAAYPEGDYSFTAETVAGKALQGRATLSHQLPAVTTFLQPPADAEGVNTSDLEITWEPTDASAYIVELEQDDLDVNLRARLPSSAHSFAVPNGFLQSGMEYQLGIGTVSTEGNVSFVETNFTTAGE